MFPISRMKARMRGQLLMHGGRSAKNAVQERVSTVWFRFLRSPKRPEFSMSRNEPSDVSLVHARLVWFGLAGRCESGGRRSRSWSRGEVRGDD
jgi:hypothetical protein